MMFCFGSWRERATVCLFFLVLSGLIVSQWARADEVVRVGGTGTGTVLLQHLIKTYRKAHPEATVQALYPSLGSMGSLRALAAGDIQIAVVSMPQGQAAFADGEKKLGYLPWVRTPMIFTGRDVSVEPGLSMEKIARIYSGDVLQWPNGKPIRLVTRSERESDTQILRAHSPEMDAAMSLAQKRIGLPFAANDIENQQLLESTPGSFGMIGLGQVLLTGSALQPVIISGVPPSTDTLSQGVYRLEKQLHLVVATTASPATMEFLQYLRSAEVLEEIRHYGFVPPRK